MLEVEASKVLIVEGVQDDPRMRDRAGRLLGGIRAPEIRTVNDEQLNAVVTGELAARPRHGMAGEIRPVVILNRFRLDDTEDQRRRRIQAWPALDDSKFNGYGGFDWRDSGTPQWRQATGLICQPAWQLHTIVGCHFRCAYCFFGWFLNVMMNVEEFVDRLDDQMRQCPGQTLFQWDNYTDAVCFEPEYGGAALLVDHFAHRPGKALELYVGKSDHVDYLLDYDHRGHTVCCWSLAADTQTRRFERLAADTGQRIESMRKCQQAGYPVRVRLSPILPVAGWRDENRRMIEQLFRDVRPDLVTIETIRFLGYDDMARELDLSLLDEDFLAAMKAAREQPFPPGCEVPDDYRNQVYEFILDELDRVSPATPVAFCREKRTIWDHFAARLARHGQTPDRYICNCGPTSVPATVAGGR
jgi:hypothetical protein